MSILTALDIIRQPLTSLSHRTPLLIVLHKLFFASALLLSTVCVSPATQAQTVTFNTNVGDIVVELFPEEAPISVENFLGYVERGDYVGTLFHRSVPGFVVQGGGFLTDGSQIPLQAPITNEFGRSNLRGTVAYARSGQVNSATSQFFFNVGDSVFLDTDNGGFTVFGEVVAGMDIVDAINGFQTLDLEGPFSDLPLQLILNGVVSLNGFTVTNGGLVVLNGVTVEPLLGDVNLDGEVNFLDISPFISILSVGDFLGEADVNQDGEVNFLDISPFISILSS